MLLNPSGYLRLPNQCLLTQQIEQSFNLNNCHYADLSLLPASRTFCFLSLRKSILDVSMFVQMSTTLVILLKLQRALFLADNGA